MDNQQNLGKLPDLASKLYEQLYERHYRDSTVSCYKTVIGKLQAFMDGNRLYSYSEDVGRRFIGFVKERMTEPVLRKAIPTINRLDDVLHERLYTHAHPRVRRDVPAAFSDLFNAFLFSRRSSGIRETTLSNDRRYLELFLDELQSAGTASPTGMNPHVIRLALSSLRLTTSFAASIRRFLAFVYISGCADNDYAAIVPKPRKAHSVPSTYSPDEVTAVLACIDRVSLVGKRDYAMLLLAARLGLRRSDILALKPKNIDCKRNVIALEQVKTGEPLELPLFEEIQEALADYIKNARPSCTEHAEIFLEHMAPYEPLSRSGLTLVAKKYFRCAGIDVKGRRRGPHALRASLATGLLAKNVPYGAISKVLGHVGESATKSYIEIDIERLRACALEVPPPSGAFASLVAARAR
ncbi:MAG: tyrosine-type recombinase/integrase [Coriobacteriales bacterium]|jgi:site-specific recombinase XerD|nr:tyrosine-type recombinase/integrase [Coriobacteriales bacterium]